MSKKATTKLVKLAPKKAAKKSAKKATTFGVPAKDLERIKKAFDGKQDIAKLTLIINNDFPEYKTYQVRAMLQEMQAGRALHTDILEAVEKLDGTEQVGL